ncbi:MAG: RNA methyltransferase [Flavobacteriales bacterium]|nr:RNA methyltransferase [Flavobacteriales bacterium]MCX7768731.1 RNA methyltransferase [Flavobacteriales bacterium]MDW8409891.1 RNA methyltransferase [Flavobacteriales bacterium]
MKSANTDTPRQKPKNQLIGGIHPVIEALKAGIPVDKVYLCKGLSGPHTREILQLCRKQSVPVRQVPESKFKRLGIAHSQGVVASLAAVEFADLESTIAQVFESGQVPLLIMLDGVTDVRNLGSIARSALCAGAHGIIVTGHHTAALHHDSVKVSAGALLHLRVHRVLSISEGIRKLHNCGLRTIALSEKGSKNLFQEDFTGPTCFIVGDEEKGLSPTALKQSSVVLQIPMPGGFASLNVSHAAAIALFETVRQRMS